MRKDMGVRKTCVDKSYRLLLCIDSLNLAAMYPNNSTGFASAKDAIEVTMIVATAQVLHVRERAIVLGTGEG